MSSSNLPTDPITSVSYAGVFNYIRYCLDGVPGFRRSHTGHERDYDIEFERLTNTGNLYFKVRSKPLHCYYGCYVGLRTGMVHMYNITSSRLSYRGVPEGIRNFYEYSYSNCGRNVPVVRPGLLKIPESLEVCNG